jgi:signal transduction histidine kinase
MPRAPLDRWLFRRMALVCGLLMAAVSLVSVAAIYAEEDIEEDLAQGARLQSIAQALLTAMEADPDFRNRVRPSAPAQRVGKPDQARSMSWRVWSSDGKLLLGDGEPAGAKPVASLLDDGLVSVDVDDRPVRVMTLRSHDGTLVVQVEEPDRSIWETANLLTHFHLALPLVFVPILGLALWMVRRTVWSVNRLTEQMRRCDPLASPRLDDGEAAPVVEPMVRALDDLLNRIKLATSVEASLRAAVAHEIRGSLAGIRAQAQLARTARAADELDEALSSLMSGTDRASRMLDQILDLARVDGIKRDSAAARESFRIPDVYRQVKEDLTANVEAKRIELSASFDASPVEGDPVAFYMLLRNLVENAIAYGPPDGRIEVRTARRMGTLVLTVDDSGPGIPAAKRELAFERFNRLGQHDTVGVGLGLWIVKRIVELHGAKIALLDSPLGGLRVEIVLEVESAVTAPRELGSAPVAA